MRYYRGSQLHLILLMALYGQAAADRANGYEIIRRDSRTMDLTLDTSAKGFKYERYQRMTNTADLSLPYRSYANCEKYGNIGNMAQIL